MTEDEWDSVINVHLRGHFVPTRHAAGYWREQTKAGTEVKASVINTSSTSGLLGNPGQTNYGAAKAGIAALTGDQSVIEEMRGIYQERRDILVRGLQAIGLVCTPPQATFYVWAEVPKGYSSASFTNKILDDTGVVVTPGNGFGAAGEGYIRFSLTVDTERLREAVARLQKLRV